MRCFSSFFFLSSNSRSFFNDTATTEIYTLSLHDALPILEEVQHETELEYSKLALTIPNVLHESVPCGDDSVNKEIREWGTIPQFDFEVKDHIDICIM